MTSLAGGVSTRSRVRFRQSVAISMVVIVEMHQRGSLQLDVLTHRLINALNNPAAGKKYECRMYDANIACRKLAVQHPTLMLRYDVGLSRKLRES